MLYINQSPRQPPYSFAWVAGLNTTTDFVVGKSLTPCLRPTSVLPTYLVVALSIPAFASRREKAYEGQPKRVIYYKESALKGTSELF